MSDIKEAVANARRNRGQSQPQTAFVTGDVRGGTIRQGQVQETDSEEQPQPQPPATDE